MTSRSLDVGSCTPHVLKMSILSFLSVMVDTGVSLCEGGRPCILEVRDIFGNRILHPPLSMQAFLDPVPRSSLAGLSVSAKCSCTGSNYISGVGAVDTDSEGNRSKTNAVLTGEKSKFIDAEYGRSCHAWDTYEVNCSSLWPDCKTGLWCCRPWFYVLENCPSVIPDVLVEGLFYSYETCSPDPVIFWSVHGGMTDIVQHTVRVRTGTR